MKEDKMSETDANTRIKGAKVRTSGWVKLARFLGIIMIVVSIIPLGFGVLFYVKTAKFLEIALRAEGKILRMEKRSSSEGAIYHPVFSFIDREGKEHEIHSSYGSYPPRYEVGDSISVLYESQNPRKAEIDSFLSLWLGSVIGFVLFGSLVLFSLLFIFIAPLIIVHIQRCFDKKAR